MPGAPSTKWNLPTRAGTDPINQTDEYSLLLAGALDALLAPSDQGLLANRPTSTGGSPSNKPGRTYWATDVVALYRDNGAGWDRISTPAGTLQATALAAAPAGYVLADGTPVARTGATADLFAAIGTTYGVGDNSTTFNLPDLRGRVPVGVDNMGGVSANRIQSGHERALAQSAGEEMHLLTIPEMPSHTHTYNLAAGAQAAAGAGAPSFAGGSGTSNLNSNTGGGTSHNNMPPYLVINYAIKL